LDELMHELVEHVVHDSLRVKAGHLRVRDCVRVLFSEDDVVAAFTAEDMDWTSENTMYLGTVGRVVDFDEDSVRVQHTL